MSSTVADKVKFLLMSKVIDFANDSFKIILMQSGFTFNAGTMYGYGTAGVSSMELATANGYVVNTKTLGAATLTEDDVSNYTTVTWANVVWTASGGPIGPTPGAIIFDDTVAVPQAKPIIGYIDFSGNQTQADGGTITISNIAFRIA